MLEKDSNDEAQTKDHGTIEEDIKNPFIQNRPETLTPTK